MYFGASEYHVLLLIILFMHNFINVIKACSHHHLGLEKNDDMVSCN